MLLGLAPRILARISASDVLWAWSFQPQVVWPLVLAVTLYVSGVGRLRRHQGRWKGGRTACFIGGIAVVFLALVSPIDPYSNWLLSVHMVQHLLLTLVAPPLLLLGRPITLALAASPRPVRDRLARLAHSRVARALGSPVVGFGSFAITMWASHFSSLYEASLANQAIHGLEHLAYLVTALLFWWPVVARDPGAARLSYPARLLYLFLAMPVMSLLGFVVSSSRRVLYVWYIPTSRSLGVSALADQRLAGTIMWESSMLVSVAALAAVLLDWMHRDEQEAARADIQRDRLAMRSSAQ